MNDHQNQFKIAMPIAKSYERPRTDGEGTSKYVVGVATGINIDRDGERMATTAVDAFKKAIDEGKYLEDGRFTFIPLITQHRGGGKHWDAHLGWVTKAEIDEHYNLIIEAELDEDSSIAMDLFRKLNRGDRPGKPLQLGFSVGGYIKRVGHEWNAELQKSVRVIEDVGVEEISVVGCPANPASYVTVLNKSYDWETIEKADTMENTMEEGKELPTETATATEVEVEVKEESVATTNEVADNNVETTSTEATEANPTSGVETALAKIMEVLSGLTETVKTLVPQAQPAAATATAKSETEESTDLKKSDETHPQINVDELKKAVADAVKETEARLTKEVTKLSEKIAELEAEPQDKSLSVAKAKGDENSDPLQTFRERMADRNADGTTKNPIFEALKVASSK